MIFPEGNTSGPLNWLESNQKVIRLLWTHVCFFLLLHSLYAGWLPLHLSPLLSLFCSSSSEFMFQFYPHAEIKWLFLNLNSKSKRENLIGSVSGHCASVFQSVIAPNVSHSTHTAGKADFKRERWSLETGRYSKRNFRERIKMAWWQMVGILWHRSGWGDQGGVRDRGAALRSSQPNWEDELFKEPSTQSGLQRILLFSKAATVAAIFQKSCHNLINFKRYHRKGGY